MTQRKTPGQPGKPDQPGKADDELVPDWLEQRYDEQSSEEPPALLDQAVMNRARAAVERPATSRRPWSFGWIHAATTAAVIVLGVTVLFQLRDQAPGAGLPPPPLPVEDQDRSDRAIQVTAESPASKAIPSNSANRAASPGAQDVMATREIRAEESAPVPLAEDQAVQRVRQRQSEPAAADLPEALKSQQFESEAMDVLLPPDATPDDIIAQLSALIAQGQIDQARVLTKAFMERWPEVEIPAELREALKP